MSDLASSNWSETAANNNAAPPDGAPEGMASSTVNNTMREGMSALKRDWNLRGAVYTTAGTANAQTITPTVDPAAYARGMVLRVLIGAALTNTGATTLKVGGLATRAIVLMDGSTALTGGELRAGDVVELVDDGTSYRLLTARAPIVRKQAISGASTDFDPIPTGCAWVDLDIYDLVASNDNVGVDITVKVSSFQTASYIGEFVQTDSGTNNTGFAQNTTSIRLSSTLGNAAGESLSAHCRLYNPDSTSIPKKMLYQSAYLDNTGIYVGRVGWGAYAGGNGAVTGLRIGVTAGTITGTAVLTCHRFA